MWTTPDTRQAMSSAAVGSERTLDLPESMFPVQNNDLIFRRWEDDIIFDSNVRIQYHHA